MYSFFVLIMQIHTLVTGMLTLPTWVEICVKLQKFQEKNTSYDFLSFPWHFENDNLGAKRLSNKETDTQTNKQLDKHIHRQKDGQKDGQKDNL